LSADDSEEIRKIGATEYEYLRRAEDITKVLEARLVVQRCLLGDFDTTMARSRLDSIMASGPSPFAAKAIRQMTSLLEAVKNGGMPADEFNRFMGHIDRFTDSLKMQIPHIIGFLKQAEERKKMRMEEHDLLQNEARYHLDSSDREARRRLEELRKLGRDVGRYHENMSSEDEDVLEDYE
ncbi:hypothetical protein KY359_00915, partial [Candidatus Woesearchaeota archaeon]|nr:hypothetical protein [Candidatus Woesearchaeota archaeon]